MAIATRAVVGENYQERFKQLKEEIERKHGKSTEQLLDEREKRVNDAIELRVPDRVPVSIQNGVFSCRYAGIPLSAMYYDHPAYQEACIKTTVDFEPDSGASMALTNSGTVMGLLGTKHQRWPGGTLPADTPYQYVEGEYMKPEEYDLFLNDPSDFIFRYYLPRIYGVLEPVTKLPPFRNMLGGMGFTSFLNLLTRPEFKELAEKLTQAAEEQERVMREGVGFSKIMTYLGFPSTYGTGRSYGLGGGAPGGSPFDAISDHLRGMRGTMLDMFRCPDKLIAACEKILEWRIAQAVPAVPDAKGYRPRAGMPLHRGSQGFMSKEQFEKFYWPTLKKTILATIDLGYIAAPFWEGIWDDRLEYLLELPKGKVVFHTELTNLEKAKAVLGGHMCIQGGVPPAMLQVASPSEVEEHCKKIIKTIGKDGGLILGPHSAMDYARPENVKAMVDSVEKYGRY